MLILLKLQVILETSDLNVKKDFRGKYLEGKSYKLSYSNRIKLPILNRDFNRATKTDGSGIMKSQSNRKGIKVYDQDQKMSWMDSSIDLSQPKIYNFRVPCHNKSTDHRTNSERSHLSSTRSAKHFGNNYVTNDSFKRSMHNHRSSQVIEKPSQLSNQKAAPLASNYQSFYGTRKMPDIKNRSLKSKYYSKVRYQGLSVIADLHQQFTERNKSARLLHLTSAFVMFNYQN